MSDDMGDKIKQLAEVLGQNSNVNIPDNVKGLFNMLMSNNNSKEKEDSPSEDTAQKSRTSDASTKDETDEMADMARKMKKAMGMLNTANDPRVNLLNAIRPYLNKNRQKKLQTCMKLIKIGSLTKVLEESE